MLDLILDRFFFVVLYENIVSKLHHLCSRLGIKANFWFFSAVVVFPCVSCAEPRNDCESDSRKKIKTPSESSKPSHTNSASSLAYAYVSTSWFSNCQSGRTRSRDPLSHQPVNHPQATCFEIFVDLFFEDVAIACCCSRCFSNISQASQSINCYWAGVSSTCLNLMVTLW